jgi:hypothetical protein
MSVLKLSWNRSLAAAAALALLGPTPGDALADNGPPATAMNHPADDDGVALALRHDDDDREEAERREPRPRRDRSHRERPEELERRFRTEVNADPPRPRERQERKYQRALRKFRERRAGLARRADEIRHHLEELGDDNPDERRALEHALRETEQRLHEIERHSQARERQSARYRDLEKMRREIERLAQDGWYEEAERLEQVARRVARELDRTTPPRPRLDRDRHPAMAEDIQRRIEHLRVAVENLHAAGMHEPAEDLTREMERIEREAREPGRPPGPPEHQWPHPLEHVVHELSAQMEEMRHDLRQLHEQIERLTGQVQDGVRIEDNDADDEEADDEDEDEDDEEEVSRK